MSLKKHLLSNIELELQKTTLIDNGEYIEVDALLMYPFRVEADMLGNPIDVTNELIQRIHDKYNQKVSDSWSFLKKAKGGLSIMGSVDDHEAIDVLTEHARGLPSVIGSIVGKLWIKTISGQKYLFAKFRIKDSNAIEKVKKKLWRYVSVGFDDSDDLFEVSIVEDPAIENAQILLSKSNKSNKEFLLSQQKLMQKQNDIKKLLDEKNQSLSELDAINSQIEQLEFNDKLKNMLSKHIDEYKIKPVEERLIEEVFQNVNAKGEAFYLLNQVLSILTPRDFNRTNLNPTRILLSNGENIVSKSFKEKLAESAANLLGKSKDDASKLQNIILSNGSKNETDPVHLNKGMPPVDSTLTTDHEDDDEKTKLSKAIHNALMEGKYEDAKKLSSQMFAKGDSAQLDPEHPGRKLSKNNDASKELLELKEKHFKLKKHVKNLESKINSQQDELVKAVTPELVAAVKAHLESGKGE